MINKKAFTLLEVLVVLVLLSMVTSALFEGLSYAMRVREGLLRQVDRQRSGMLQSVWIRSVIGGTVPVSLPRKGEFNGESDHISGVSNGTLGGIPGAPGRYSLKLEKEGNELLLHYTDQYGAHYPLGSWKDADGHFVFINTFKTFSRWPPKSLLKEFKQLPDTIMLQIDKTENTQCWIIALSGRHEPKSTIQQVGI